MENIKIISEALLHLFLAERGAKDSFLLYFLHERLYVLLDQGKVLAFPSGEVSKYSREISTALFDAVGRETQIWGWPQENRGESLGLWFIQQVHRRPFSFILAHFFLPSSLYLFSFPRRSPLLVVTRCEGTFSECAREL